MIKRLADGRTDLVFDLIDDRHAATLADENGVRLIQHCAYYGDVSAIRFLLLNGEALQSLGENLDLSGAAFHGHWRLCQFLLEQGAAVNFTSTETGETALHAALSSTRATQQQVVQVLLAAGADPNIATKPGVETGAFMRDARTRGETPLHRAAAFASEETIQFLLDAGARVEAKDIHGDTPLSWASWHLRPDTVLRKLLYGKFSIRAGRRSMDSYLQGAPHKPE